MIKHDCGTTLFCLNCTSVFAFLRSPIKIEISLFLKTSAVLRFRFVLLKPFGYLVKWKGGVGYSVTRPLETSKPKILDKRKQIPCMISN